MQIQPIHTEDDYQKALDRIEEIFDAKPASSVMEPYLPIALKRIAIARMQAVERGTLSRSDAEQSIKRICRLSKSDLTAHLTREYDQLTVEAFQYFRLI